MQQGGWLVADKRGYYMRCSRTIRLGRKTRPKVYMTIAMAMGTFGQVQARSSRPVEFSVPPAQVTVFFAFVRLRSSREKLTARRRCGRWRNVGPPHTLRSASPFWSYVSLANSCECLLYFSLKIVAVL